MITEVNKPEPPKTFKGFIEIADRHDLARVLEHDWDAGRLDDTEIEALYEAWCLIVPRL